MKLHKKLIGTVLLAVTLSTQVFAIPFTMTYEGKGTAVDFELKVIEGTTYVPLRSVCESMGFNLGWNGKTKEATITVARKKIGLDTAKIEMKDGFIDKDRTFVSLGWIEKQLGIKLQVTHLSNEEKSVQVANYLINGAYDKIIGMMDEATKTLIDENILKQQWQSVVGSLGKVQSCKFDQGNEGGGYYQGNTKIIFDKAHVRITTVFNTAGELMGLQIGFYAKEVARPEGVVEKDIVVQTGDYALPGTLTLPQAEGNFPVVVLVHGSGPNDRDETAYGVKVFRDLAYGLAEQGIATLRYDKRTYVYMQEVMANPSRFDYYEEVIDDAVSAIELMKNTPNIDANKIFVLGHSLGAMSIPMISTKDEGVAGYMMVAGPSRNLVDVVLEQVDYLATAQEMPQAQKQVYIQMITQQAEAVRTLTPESNVQEMNFMGINNKVWGQLNTYNQVEVAKQMTEPVLVVQGGRDYQVTMQDFNLWEQGLKDNANFTFKAYNNLNHLLVEGKGKSTPEEYYMPAEISKTFVKDLGSWILEQ